MSVLVTAHRVIGAASLTKTLELPIAPMVGYAVKLDEHTALAISGVVVTPIPSPWTPGIGPPRVAIGFYAEPADRDRYESAVADGWKDKTHDGD